MTVSWPCARCATGRYYIPTGCLCDRCDEETMDMTQDELNADYARYSTRKKRRGSAAVVSTGRPAS